MKIRSISNTALALENYQYKPNKMSPNHFGRFGVTSQSKFCFSIGEEFLVMGMLLSEGDLHYLVDHHGLVFTFPYPLFEVIDNKLPRSWYFRAIDASDANYPYQEAFWGYHEFVFEENYLEKIFDREETAMRTYFRRKIEFEKELEEDSDYLTM